MASDLHLKGSICAIAAAPLKAGDFFSFSQKEMVSGSGLGGQQHSSSFLLGDQWKERMNCSQRYKRVLICSGKPFTLNWGKRVTWIHVYSCVYLQLIGRLLTFFAPLASQPPAAAALNCLSLPVAQKSPLHSATLLPPPQHRDRKAGAEVTCTEDSGCLFLKVSTHPTFA